MVDAANAKTEKADPDFAIDLTGGAGSDEGSDQEWELDDSDVEQEEEEGLGGGKPAAKKRKGAAGTAVEAAPKAKAKSATPAKKVGGVGGPGAGGPCASSHRAWAQHSRTGQQQCQFVCVTAFSKRAAYGT